MDPDGGRSKGIRQKEEGKEKARVLLHPEIPEVSFRVLVQMGMDLLPTIAATWHKEM